MHAASCFRLGRSSRRHQHHRHHRGPRGLEEFIAFMASGGRGGPPWADPRHVQGDVLGPGPGGPGGPAAGTAAVPIGAAAVPGAATCAPRAPAPDRGRPAERLPAHPGDRAAHGGRVEAEPRLGLPGPPAARGRRPGPRRRVRGQARLRAHGRGPQYVDTNREELGDPFDAATGGIDESVMDLRGLMFQVGAAAMQVAAAGHTDEAARSSPTPAARSTRSSPRTSRTTGPSVRIRRRSSPRPAPSAPLRVRRRDRCSRQGLSLLISRAG